MNNPTQTEELADFARFLAAESAQSILPLFRTNLPVEIKGTGQWDPVTEADKAAERVIRHHIETRYPDHGIIGEEYGTKQGRSGFQWILDPIDGTRSFVIGMPTWATLIGLYYEGQPLLGIMNQPFVGEMFVGQPSGSTVERNGMKRPLRVRQCNDLSSARIGTTTAHFLPSAEHGKKFDALCRAVQLVRYSGDAYFFCLLAAGHLDIALDAQLQIYDVAALIPIITGAGGCVAEWHGADPNKGGNIIAANSRKILDEAMALLQN
jgi:myo-inositol-1(or 4)-monophosphatase